MTVATSGTVTASQYGGSDGDHIGSTQYGFAELSNNHADPQCLANGICDFSALGNLPRGTLLRVSYNGKSIVVPKVDVGGGGPGLGGKTRAIDLTASAARDLGFTGLGNVTYQILGRGRTVGSAITPPAATVDTTSITTTTGASNGIFTTAQHSQALYALVFVGVVALGLVLGIGGLNRATGGAIKRTAGKAAKTAAIA